MVVVFGIGRDGDPGLGEVVGESGVGGCGCGGGHGRVES